MPPSRTAALALPHDPARVRLVVYTRAATGTVRFALAKPAAPSSSRSQSRCPRPTGGLPWPRCGTIANSSFGGYVGSYGYSGGIGSLPYAKQVQPPTVSIDAVVERYDRQREETSNAAAEAAAAAVRARHEAERARLEAERTKLNAAEEAAAKALVREPVKISDECWKNPLC